MTMVVLNVKKNQSDFICILAISILIGILTGLICILFNYAIHQIESLRNTLLTPNDPTWKTGLLIILSSAILSGFSFYLVKKFSPESAGSGIQEIEGALSSVRPSRWKRVLPVKFFAGICALGAGLVLGREGPSVQIGANIGAMLSDVTKRHPESKHIFIASGAAAGLAAAFNAPLAGILFVLEEMREQFHYNFISLKSVILAAIASTMVFHFFVGEKPLFSLPEIGDVSQASYGLFFVLGLGFGAFGVLFNKLILYCMDFYQSLHRNEIKRFSIIGMILGSVFGLLIIFVPTMTGEGANLVADSLQGHFSFTFLIGLFILRLIATLACFCSGASGGVFAPMLALGALSGGAFGLLCQSIFPALDLSIGMFVVAGMCALFCATVRAPLTGIILVLELTNEYALLFPLVIAATGAILAAYLLGGKPLYSQLLERTLKQMTSSKGTIR